MYEYDVFLSFASSDENTVRPIWQELSLSGLRVFWSDETLKKNVGQSFFNVIQRSLSKSQHFILVCTDASLSSKWVRLEYEAFFSNYHIKDEEQRRLILLTSSDFDRSKLPLFFKNIQTTETVKEIIPLVGGVDIQLLIRENEELKRKLSNANNRILELKFEGANSTELMNKNDALQKQIKRLKKETLVQKNKETELAIANEKVVQLQSELKRASSLETENQDLSKNIETLKKKIASHKKTDKELFEANKRFEELRAEVEKASDLESENKNLGKEIESLKKELNSLKMKHIQNTRVNKLSSFIHKKINEFAETAPDDPTKTKERLDSSNASSVTKERSSMESRKGLHHWSRDYDRNKKITICEKCGDIHHGSGFKKCEGCGSHQLKVNK